MPWTSLAACHILRCLNSCLLCSSHCLQLFLVPFFFLCGFSGQLEAVAPQCGGPSASSGSIKKGCPVEHAAAPQEVVGKKRQRTVTGDCTPIPLTCEGGSLRSYRFLLSTWALTNRGIGAHESRRKMHPQAKCFGRSLRKGLKRDPCRSLQRDTPCL